MTLSLFCLHNNNVVSSPSLGCSASQYFRPANFHRSYPAFDLPWLHTKKSPQFLLLALISTAPHCVCWLWALGLKLHRVLQSSRDETTSGEEEERRKNLCLLNRQESFSLESFESPRICLRHAILMDLRRENFSTIFFSSPLLLLVRLLCACDFELCRELTWISAADIRLKVSSASAVDFLDEARKLSPSFGRPLTATAEFQREILSIFRKKHEKLDEISDEKSECCFFKTQQWPDRLQFHLIAPSFIINIFSCFFFELSFGSYIYII